MHRVTPTGNERGDRPRRQTGDSECVHREAGVVGPRHGEDGTAEPGEKVPQRLLCARPAKPQARGEARRRVAQTFGPPGRVGQGEPLEHGAAQPGVDKSLDVTRGFELVRQVVVGSSSSLAFGGILNAGGRADEDSAMQRQIGTERHVQGHPGTERVAEQRAGVVADSGSHGGSHEVGRRRQVGPHLPRVAVPGEIHRNERVGFGQEISKEAPEATGLREPVQHHHRRPRAAEVDMKWHAG